MAYCSSTEVYYVAGITSSEIGTTEVDQFIEEATAIVDRYTGTHYITAYDSSSTGTATAGSTTTITDSGQSWTADAYIGQTVYIYEGTGVGQARYISDNTTTVLTVDVAFATTPDTTSKYIITSNVKVSETRDGDNTDVLFTKKHPILDVESIEVEGTSVTPSKVYQYKEQGKLLLHAKIEPEVSYWTYTYPQSISLVYYHGIYPIPDHIKRFTRIIAAIKTLVSQIGGTFDDVTSYTIPHFSASKGEPYTNIRETVIRLTNEMERLKKEGIIHRYAHIG